MFKTQLPQTDVRRTPPWPPDSAVKSRPLRNVLWVTIALTAVVIALTAVEPAGGTPTVSADPVPPGSDRGYDPASGILFADDFTGPDGLITNHYSRWSGDPTATQSPDWEMDSGSFFRQSNTGWTGVPTSNIPNKHSSNGSGSEVFRLFTKRDDFRDVSVTFDLRNNGYTSASDERPAVSWDGVKVYLRRQSGASFYVAEVNRRQGNIMVQKKCTGRLSSGAAQATGGTYFVLAQTGAVHPALVGQWEKVGGTVETNADGSVTLNVIRDGDVALSVTDRGTGCASLTAAGSTGVRGDNTDFNIDDFRVRDTGSGP
jgi:hypothetical protein